MNWEQKFQALMAICPEVSLKMRKPGDWFVSIPWVSRREGSVLSSGCDSAKSPEEAVAQRFEWATNPKFYLVTTVNSCRRAVKWNGFMWADVDETVAV